MVRKVMLMGCSMTANSEASRCTSLCRPAAGTFWATTGLFSQQLVISMSSTAAVNKVELEGVNSELLACPALSFSWRSCDLAACLQSGAWWSAGSPRRASGHACSQSVSELICPCLPSLWAAACPAHLREELGVQMPGSMPCRAACPQSCLG